MSKKAYTPRFSADGKLSQEYLDLPTKKLNPANFASTWNEIDHVATAHHKNSVDAKIINALEAETGRTNLSLSQLKSI